MDGVLEIYSHKRASLIVDHSASKLTRHLAPFEGVSHLRCTVDRVTVTACENRTITEGKRAAETSLLFDVIIGPYVP